MSEINSICVFCGSKAGCDPDYQQSAQELGRLLAERKITLVYGGGSVGLMGIIADAVLEAGGKVIGVIPRQLATKELLHPGVDEMHVVDDMHTRKAKMSECSDAFIAMPGGFGTLEELFEVVSWVQLGIYLKPIGLLNTSGFYDPLLNMVEHCIETEFIKPKYRELIIADETPATLVDHLQRHQLPLIEKILNPEQI
ncbi:LOG family protein [Gimesia panareensis]|uniref:Cytokinin riboside 5'-monophosphate phosphoribohydrolase n=1 Tax=Gimesia panareensis TaxID=2527978 RepID=A0A517QDQ3_9PLAN|nr:TIGR00730 family Rossman fold protein [Gimesia panareensis]QDT29761.1 LOG family protein YvdD [Gimesia panareensis]QDU52848.1 LOG family protein YvdD [Gimesia panareensis]